MSKIVFLQDPSTVYDATFSQIGENQVRLVFSESVPSDNVLLSGFNLINENNGHVQASRTDYTHKYRTYSKDLNKIELCNDGVAWVRPDYVTKFVVPEGAVLDGEAEQKVMNYEDLSIPSVSPEEGFEFVEWKPEIPEEGEIEKNDTFRASLLDKNVYFHTSGGGSLEGQVKQFVDDYSKLAIPKATPDENYKFVSWMPEIPKDGKIDMDNRHFYAVFESNIPDRVKTVESDLTDAQLALVENYTTALATEQEVTDCQLALVEIYDLIMGGM